LTRVYVSVYFYEKKILFTGYDGNDGNIFSLVIAIIALIASEFIYYYKKSIKQLKNYGFVGISINHKP